MNFIETGAFFNELVTFCEVVDANSFSKAALKLGSHHSTISRRIQNLEHALGTQVFVRSTRKLVLTDAGALLYESFLQQKASLQNTINSIQLTQKNLGGKLRIAIPTMISYKIISPYLAEFLNDNPDITLEVFYLNQELDLVDNFFDLVIINYIPTQQAIKIKKLTTLRFGFYCTPSYIQRYGEPNNSLIGNEKHLFIGTIKDNMTVYNTYPVKNIRTNEVTDIKYHARLYSNNGAHSIPIIKNGYAIAPILTSSVTGLLERGELVHVLPDYCAELSYYLVKVNMTNSVIFTKLTNFIENCFKRYIKENNNEI